MKVVTFWICLLLICTCIHTWAQSKHRPLTIVLNPGGEGYDQYYVAGDFSNWKIEAMKFENNAWAYEVKLVPQSSYQYFFLHAADWAAKEPMNGECFFKGEHRVIQMTPYLERAENTFGTCDEFPGNSELYVEAIFKLKTPIDDANVEYYIAGNFTNWIPKPLERNSKNRHSIRMKIPKGYTGRYFYLAGDNWSEREPFPGSSCTRENDRYFDPFVEKRVIFNDMFGDCGG